MGAFDWMGSGVGAGVEKTPHNCVTLALEGIRIDSHGARSQGLGV